MGDKLRRKIFESGQSITSTDYADWHKSRCAGLGGGWIAPEVIFMIDGKVVTTEKYSEIRGDVALDPKLFDPQFWTTVYWKK